ncbi:MULTISPECIES: phosphatidylserine decarboxylase family protein [unclassified Spirosoma]|uniref:phosphatidylserine decarboxylase family protein n=1 Tax=unclassified Spirosoma TaxID=2621999 RepID=UPI000966A639|nr:MULTISPECIES: phosphatidylserine decarboxylase family protein [unclassified Spirosoma]MBN8824063.1 phosphatidylserine decarboxylase family protein [Spirosoma sp.]OJW70464.1 MAG: phosphatidylserine decarboxylase [Spirosoma sp. 48-14]
MRLHREGTTIMITTGLVLLALNLLAYFYLFSDNSTAILLLALVSLILFILVVQFFRVPNRLLTVGDTQVIAPADGKVVVIEETTESEYFNDRRRQVSIFMSPLNVHVNRNPVSGIVRYFKYFPGKYLVAWHPKSSTENERTTVVIETANGVQVLLRQIAGAVARRIIWYVKEGQPVKQGEEFGFIKFGSRVDVFLPLDADIKVAIGDVTRGGVTVLAELK